MTELNVIKGNQIIFICDFCTLFHPTQNRALPVELESLLCFRPFSSTIPFEACPPAPTLTPAKSNFPSDTSHPDRSVRTARSTCTPCSISLIFMKRSPGGGRRRLG